MRKYVCCLIFIHILSVVELTSPNNAYLTYKSIPVLVTEMLFELASV